jgi:hypothetical protein
MFDPQFTPIQPINVIVQPAPGIPAWAISLLSAGAGAVLGFIGGLAAEYAKPLVNKMRMRPIVRNHIQDEFLINYNAVNAAQRILTSGAQMEPPDRSYALRQVREILADIKRDRYDLYFSTEKTLVYEIDKFQTLADFYAVMVRETETAGDERVEYEMVSFKFDSAKILGHRLLSEKGIDYEPKPNQHELMFYNILEAMRGLK